MEVYDSENRIKMDKLADRLKEVVPEGAVVNRPMKMADLKLVGFDESVLPDDINRSVAQMGECETHVKIGRIQLLLNGLNIAWLRCSLTEAVSSCDWQSPPGVDYCKNGAAEFQTSSVL